MRWDVSGDCFFWALNPIWTWRQTVQQRWRFFRPPFAFLTVWTELYLIWISLFLQQIAVSWRGKITDKKKKKAVFRLHTHKFDLISVLQELKISSLIKNYCFLFLSFVIVVSWIRRYECIIVQLVLICSRWCMIQIKAYSRLRQTVAATEEDKKASLSLVCKSIKRISTDAALTKELKTAYPHFLLQRTSLF